jgi:kumamolisin
MLQSSHSVLPGSNRELLPNSRAAGPVNRDEVAAVTVRVRSKGKFADLEKHVQKLYQQPLKSRQYLSRADLATQYGADEKDLDAIETFALEHNLMVTFRCAAERSVVLRGRLGDLLNAFPCSVMNYHHATGTYRGRRGDILIPQQFQGVITGIFGFDTRPKHRSRVHARSGSAAGPGGKNGVASTDFAKRYNFPTTFQNTKLDGTGQTIGIIELGGGYKPGDIATYFKEIKVSKPNVVAVSVDHGHNTPTNPQSADGEVMLDIEVAGAVAPHARIAVYFAPNQGNGMLDAISAAVHDAARNPSVISISWGEPEDFLDAQALTAYHEMFVAAAAAGVTICTAAGDHGTADMEAQNWDNKIHVDHPSSDDYVLACGGTQIDSNTDVVWNDGTSLDEGGWSTGGGVSVVTALPSYQNDAGIPNSLVSHKKGRGVPDIAMSATNYFTRVDGFEGASGGTSAVAPLMAGLVVLLNQAKGKHVGFLNPFLYGTQGVTKDVTKGNNGLANTTQGYSAGNGWDACSGLGTPDGTAIVNNL